MKLVVFDFDDTLEDFRPAKHKVAKLLTKHIKKKYNIDNFGEEFNQFEEHQLKIGMRTKNYKLYARELWMKLILAKHGIKINNKEADKLKDFYWLNINKIIKPMKHAQVVLKTLKKRGYKIALLTDSDGTKKIKLDRIKITGILKYLDVIAYADDLKTTKPEKKFYNYIFKKLKTKPDKMFMVGDKPEFDLKLAKKLGFTTIWIKHGDWAMKEKKKPGYVDHEIHDLKELIKFTT